MKKRKLMMIMRGVTAIKRTLRKRRKLKMTKPKRKPKMMN